MGWPVKGRRLDAADLPVGKTCGDCVHIQRCRWLINANDRDERCDWEPSRFRASPGKDQKTTP
jgi:hypothetical protein